MLSTPDVSQSHVDEAESLLPSSPAWDSPWWDRETYAPTDKADDFPAFLPIDATLPDTNRKRS